MEEKAFRTGWGAHRERVRRRSALVWRRRRSGGAGVRVGNAERQTRKERSGVAGRRTCNRSEDGWGVLKIRICGRDFVGGEIQEELKHPTDCWSVPVCWVWSDSNGGVQTPMGTQGVSQCFGCGVVGEGEEDFDDGNFYCIACWLIYHAAQAQGRQDTAHVQPARNLQGVSYAPESAQHERSVEDLTLGRRPQLQRPSACTERCTVQNTSFIFEQRAQRACTQITTQAAHARDLEAEFTQVGGWDTSSDSDTGVEESDRGDRDVEGSEEHFDESEHVDGFAEEERSTDGEDGSGEEVDESEGEGCHSPEGSPEGSDFAAEEGYEEGDSNTVEGHEEV